MASSGGSWESEQVAAQIATKVPQGQLFFSPADYCAGPWSEATAQQQHNALAAACAAASAGAGGGIVRLPQGQSQIVGTFPFVGYRLGGFVGAGSSWSGVPGAPVGSVVVATAQTGPVLDFTGTFFPTDYMAKVIIGDFSVRGDGTADTSTDAGGVGGVTKIGVKMGHSDSTSDPYPISLSVRNIATSNTGGSGFWAKDMYLSEVTGVVVSDPVDAVANNVPSCRLIGCNGTRFIGLGHRSTDHTAKATHPATVPAAGVLRTEASSLAGGFYFHRSLFLAPWFENYFCGAGTAIVVAGTNQCTYSDPQFFDCFKVSGATNTAYFEFIPSVVTDSGGNIYRGIVEGNYPSDSQWIDTGISVSQSYNFIHGVKGYAGGNVTLNPGVKCVTVDLHGSAGASSAAAVIDNSGNAATHTMHDDYLGTHQYGAAAGNASLQVSGQAVRFNRAAVATVGNFNPNMSGDTQHFVFTLGASGTCGAPSNAGGAPRPITIMLIQDATGSRTVTWNAVYKFAGGAAPALSTSAGKVDTFTFMYDGAAWREVARSIGS